MAHQPSERRLAWLARRPPAPIRLRLGWVGYRGAALLLFGIIYLCMGVAVTFNPTVDPHLWHTSLPIPVRVTIWSGAGMLAVLAAFLPRWEILGFSTLFIGPFERFLSFLGAMVGQPSLARLTGVLVYLLLAMIVVLLAAWPEPTTPASPSSSEEPASPDSSPPQPTPHISPEPDLR